jgi:2Fe-2S ferredoxin
MLKLKGRTIEKSVNEETGLSILDLAMKHEVDWGFSCTRGTCARCRCHISEGMELLNDPTDEEFDRLDEEEIEQGYRLACQAIVKGQGTISAVNKPYF